LLESSHTRLDASRKEEISENYLGLRRARSVTVVTVNHEGKTDNWPRALDFRDVGYGAFVAPLSAPRRADGSASWVFLMLLIME
jgi:hypothetical protein